MNDTELEKFARIETTDTLWKINLIQVIDYLKQVLNSHFEVAFSQLRKLLFPGLEKNSLNNYYNLPAHGQLVITKAVTPLDLRYSRK
ncbi:MAG: hypothetical protein COW65_12165 [Cytophagales bacterium CG18_big_fil_WC_8_21_14_2_50_42_9]|nr:MAG: hypothetical protein COW65_12165 [Cytophagales bacterium CG18_big_fil_WC_8_21_14_2_50_42_9]